MERQHIITTIREWGAQRSIDLCVLFGSQATGKTHQHSDVDVAIWTTRDLSPPEHLEWVVSLENALDCDVSLVFVTMDLDPVLQFEIARQGVLAFEREPNLWANRRLQLWHAYNDSLPFRRAARRQLHDFAEEIRHAT